MAFLKDSKRDIRCYTQTAKSASYTSPSLVPCGLSPLVPLVVTRAISPGVSLSFSILAFQSFSACAALAFTRAVFQRMK